MRHAAQDAANVRLPASPHARLPVQLQIRSAKILREDNRILEIKEGVRSVVPARVLVCLAAQLQTERGFFADRQLLFFLGDSILEASENAQREARRKPERE